MPFALDQFLYTQAIRLLRQDWGKNAQLLGDEFFTILSSIQVAGVAQPETDENGNPTTLPDPFVIPGIPVYDYDINPQDPTIPTDPFERPDPDDPDFPDSPGNSKKFWHRASHIGKVTGDGPNDAGEFTVELYINGLTQEFITSRRTVEATITDIDKVGDVEKDMWINVQMVAQYEARKVETDSAKVAAKPELIHEEYFFNAPGGGGGKIGVVTTEISGGTASEPGTGEVRTKKLVNDAWVDASETSTVYSTVTGKVKAGKDVQMKLVAGKLFVDVEDCGAQDDDPAQEGG